MNFNFILMVVALGAAPAPSESPETEAPQRIFIRQGTAFQCTVPGGCYVANGAGLEELVREVAAQARASCPRPGLSL